jgi:uncharacterized protein YpmS
VRVISNLLMAIGVIAIVVFIFVMVGYGLYSSTPDMKDQIGEPVVSADAAESYAAKFSTFVNDIEDSAIEGVKKEVSVTFTIEEVSSKIVELMAEGTFPFKDMRIGLRQGECWLYFVTDTFGANAKIGMILRPSIQNGDIHIEMVDFHIGKLPLPKSFDEDIGGFVNVLVNMENPANDLPLELTSIAVGDGTFTLKGMTQPAE